MPAQERCNAVKTSLKTTERVFLTVRVDVRVRVECLFASSLSRHRGKHVLRGSRSLTSVPESTLVRPPPTVHNSRLMLSWIATTSRAEVWCLSISCGAGHSVFELRCTSVSSAPSAPAGPFHDRGLMGTCSSDDHWCALMANVCKLFVNQPGSIAAVGSVLQSWTRLLTWTRTSSNEIRASTVRHPRAERVRLVAKLQHDDHIHRVIFRGFGVLNKSTIPKGKKGEEELKRSNSQGPQQDSHGHEHGVWTQAGCWLLAVVDKVLAPEDRQHVCWQTGVDMLFVGERTEALFNIMAEKKRRDEDLTTQAQK